MNKANLMKYAAAQRQADTGSIPIPQPKPQQQQIAPQVQQALSELETQAQLAARFVANADEVQQQDVVAVTPKVRHDVAPVSFDETEQLPSVPEKPAEPNISILPATETITDEIAVYIAQYFSPKSVKIEPARLLDNHHSLFCPADENEISELKDSIDRTGITEPLLVRSIGDGDYEIISGHRRRIAAEMLNWQLLPCRVADNAMNIKGGTL